MDRLENRLVQLRKEHKITQEELAKKIGVSRTTLVNYENGRRKPDYEILQRIANFFEVSTDHLLGRDFTEEEKEVITKMNESVPLEKIAKEHEITLYGKVLNAEQKKLMLMFAKTLLDNEKE